MSIYAEVVLPIPLPKTFVYSIPEDMENKVEVGMRVAVPFGKGKTQAGIVLELHREVPEGIKFKDIFYLLDDKPIVKDVHIRFWKWISDYYMCTLGEVFRAALPSGMRLESDMILSVSEDEPSSVYSLSQEERDIVNIIRSRNKILLKDLLNLLELKNPLMRINDLLGKKVIELQEHLREKYKPLIKQFVFFTKPYESDEFALSPLFSKLEKRPKQRELLLCFLSMKKESQRPISVSELLKRANVSKSTLDSLIKKEVLRVEKLQIDRTWNKDISSGKALPNLSNLQDQTSKSIRQHIENVENCVLYGITSSGKTEIFAHLIQEQLNLGKQVLYLIPEIALTTQLIYRLQAYFSHRLLVFHSRQSLHEKTEIWNRVREDDNCLIIGVRSSIFLPFSNLGLIIVDEEHDGSFKQNDPAPRYNARDSIIMLGGFLNIPVLLGSATPALETCWNAKKGKYKWIVLSERYEGVQMPEIQLIDLKEAKKRRQMHGVFSYYMHAKIKETLLNKNQIILFQNRRGYAPIIECESCGFSPECANCDITLTFHKFSNELKCHYCGYTQPAPVQCWACESALLNAKGLGTQQIELECKKFFSDAVTQRMDLDTTRGKYRYQEIIHSFSNQKIDILVGTQMVSKGLDFDKVEMVGILNADSLLKYPDFRAEERAHQLITQVAGRAGRKGNRGVVMLQTYMPLNRILKQVQNDQYDKMIDQQILDRQKHNYPPYCSLIRILFKHRNRDLVYKIAQMMADYLTKQFGHNVLGPEEPPIRRLKNLYLQRILIKLEKKNLRAQKKYIQKLVKSFYFERSFRSVKIIIDVDPL